MRLFVTFRYSLKHRKNWFSDFWKIFRFLEVLGFLEDFQISGRFSDFWKIFRFLEDFQIFGRFSDFWKIFRFLDNPRTFDIWDTVCNSDNWEPVFMTIFVIWQLSVTLDSIRNSCDVLSDLIYTFPWALLAQSPFLYGWMHFPLIIRYCGCP